MGTGSGPNFGKTKGAIARNNERKPQTLITKSKIKADSLNHVIDWAVKKRDELTGKTKKNFNTACVVYDSENNKYYYGRNGGYHEDGYVRNPLLFGDTNVKGLLPHTSLNKYPIGNCAEVDAVNRALNAGAKLNNLYMTTIHVTKNKFGTYKPACENCTFTFRGKVSDNFSGWFEEGGK